MARKSKTENNSIKVAVVHDWLTGMRGGEKVLESILDLFPGADLYTLIHNKGSVSEKIENRNIYTSFVDRMPFKKSKYRNYLPLFPTAIELFDFHGYDLVISSSHCTAKGVIVPPGVPHVSFIHSPMRYVWDMYFDYFPPRGFLNRYVIPYFANSLRTWDSASAHRVDSYVSNSAFVASRIKRFYGRSAEVIFPPCIPDRKVTHDPVKGREEFYLIVSALVPYKKIDLAIEAFREMNQRLVIVGKGPDLKKLKVNAPGNVEFTGHLPWNEVETLFQKARALIFPGLEDFGIVPVEAQAFGCPVIAYGAGGALESVVDGKTGLFFQKQSPESLREAISRFEKASFKISDFQKNIERFTESRFRDRFYRVVANTMKEYGKELPSSPKAL